MQEDGDDAAVKIENLYYNSKGLVSSDAVEAGKGFREVLAIADAGGKPLADWGYKATKQLVKLSFRTGQLSEMLTWYRALLAKISAGDITRNRAEKAINSILDLVGSGGGGGGGGAAGAGEAATDGNVLLDFYSSTLGALQSGGNEVSWGCSSLQSLCQPHMAGR